MGYIRVRVGESLTTRDGQDLETESFSKYNLDGAKFRAEQEGLRVYLYVQEIESGAQYLAAFENSELFESLLPEGLCWYILKKGLPDRIDFPDEEYDEDGNEIEV